MQIRIIGEHPLARDGQGQFLCRIATVFPRAHTIVTLPGIHATQRMAFVDAVNAERAAAGLPPLREAEQLAEWENSVDLVLEDGLIHIRPDPRNMAAAFEADELLQELVPKECVRFLNATDERVREAIKRRGECWRISPVPRSPDDMKRMIQHSRIGIGGQEIYYYNRSRGTRLLTYQEFCRLGALDDEALRAHLLEIRRYSGRGNRLGSPEIAFFTADPSFSAESFARFQFDGMDGPALRRAFEELRAAFREAVKPEYRADDIENPQWRAKMYEALADHTDTTVSEENLLGLSPEFFMQIDWLPGARIQDGEVIFDSVLDDPGRPCVHAHAARPCDEKVRAFIFNFIREYGDLEYINVGRVVGSLSLRPQRQRTIEGRRDVYIAEMQQKGSDRPIVRMIRMQKWGIRERLDERKPLLRAMIESEEYTEYVLDRRLACRQLGMNLPVRITSRKVPETYDGVQSELAGTTIWSPYFERDYIQGMATDKVPDARMEDPVFAVALARLLGAAAAPNLIVGRADEDGQVVFDDGDEVLLAGESEAPQRLVVTDHTGSFADYRTDLRQLVVQYARPVRRRVGKVREIRLFAEVYIRAFEQRFAAIQQEYRRRRRAFDTLFRDRRRDEAGSFAYRWECVLARLDRVDAEELGSILRSQLRDLLQ